MSESSTWFDALFRRNETENRTRSRSNCVSSSTGDSLSQFRQLFNLNGLTNTGESIASLGYVHHSMIFFVNGFYSMIDIEKFYLDQWVNFWKNLKLKNIIRREKMMTFDLVLDLCKDGGKENFRSFLYSFELI